MTTTFTDIFTGQYTDRHLTELASRVERLRHYVSYSFVSPSGRAWLGVTFEVHDGSWVASLTTCDGSVPAGHGDHMEWSMAHDIVERFIEP